MAKGIFITIEGCEGVGKSTQLSLLKQYLASKGVKAVFTREPGGTPISEQIRKIILSQQSSFDGITELLLYAAARRQHTTEFIRPHLERGYIVVCDRYSDSTLAYQGYGRGLDKTLIKRINDIATDGISIDLTLFLDLPPHEGFARKGGADKTDRLESEPRQFHERVYAGFKEIAINNPHRVVTVDASCHATLVSDDIIAAVTEKIKALTGNRC